MTAGRERAETGMSERIHEVGAEWKSRAFIDKDKYEEMYARSLSDPAGFWGEHGKRIDWTKPFFMSTLHQPLANLARFY